MDATAKLEELETLARDVGVRVQYEAMTGVVSGRGGLCKVRGEYRVIIDRRLKPADRVQFLAEALRPLAPPDEGLSAPVRALLAS